MNLYAFVVVVISSICLIMCVCVMFVLFCMVMLEISNIVVVFRNTVLLCLCSFGVCVELVWRRIGMFFEFSLSP